MGYRENQAASQNLADSMTDDSADPMELGFGQSTSVAYAEQKAEYLPGSEALAEKRFFGARNATLDQMIEDGEIPEDVAIENRNVTGINRINGMEQTSPDYHALAAWSNDNTGSEFDVDDSEMIETMRWERRERERQLANGNFVGELAGGIGASMTDPVLLGLTVATLPFSGAAIPARFVPSMVARTAIAESLLGVVSEIPLQAKVIDFKERIDAPYTIQQAMANVALAGVASGVFAGGIALIGKGFTRALDLKASDLSKAEPSSEIDYLIDEMSELPPETTVGQHLDELHGAEQDINKPLEPSLEEREEFFDVPAEDVADEIDRPLYDLTPEDREVIVPLEDGTERKLGEIADELSAGDDFDRKLEAFNACMLGSV